MEMCDELMWTGTGSDRGQGGAAFLWRDYYICASCLRQRQARGSALMVMAGLTETGFVSDD
jgi:hypothetical protein